MCLCEIRGEGGGGGGGGAGGSGGRGSFKSRPYTGLNRGWASSWELERALWGKGSRIALVYTILYSINIIHHISSRILIR